MENYQRIANTKCTVCSSSIYRRPSEIKKNDGRVFCSQVCYGIFCRKEKPCIVCGVAVLAGKNKKTCSRACANKHRSGMKYAGSRPHDKVVYQRGLKLRLLENRGRACERCGYDKYQILHVHHIDRNRNNNDLANLALICPNCHAEEHYFQNSWLTNKYLTNTGRRGGVGLSHSS